MSRPLAPFFNATANLWPGPAHSMRLFLGRCYLGNMSEVGSTFRARVPSRDGAQWCIRGLCRIRGPLALNTCLAAACGGTSVCPRQRVRQFLRVTSCETGTDRCTNPGNCRLRDLVTIAARVRKDACKRSTKCFGDSTYIESVSVSLIPPSILHFTT
ncbi:uncharacterized protein LY79DRAFT_237782 [Colletotrichum navitas]|uniref:Uncharacterized protein n=1 Tax=Colletotrichum navitas TaxID=681940 RepID=A0AAD8V3U1_9PEZI|nr:uncharacterized protein LY79DRAFT_237782 [Colletotrichum navitas]KAK1589667.1 hypothetical protein LY79DRAFT_237782 [Colletotrichum navitas]